MSKPTKRVTSPHILPSLNADLLSCGPGPPLGLGLLRATGATHRFELPGFPAGLSVEYSGGRPDKPSGFYIPYRNTVGPSASTLNAPRRLHAAQGSCVHRTPHTEQTNPAWRLAGPPKGWTVGPQELLPTGAGLVLEQVQLCGGVVHLFVHSSASGASCPVCGCWSEAFLCTT